MADVMAEAGVAPYLQFGEVQWWYFADAAGMPFYDELHASGCSRRRTARRCERSQASTRTRTSFPQECELLPG